MFHYNNEMIKKNDKKRLIWKLTTIKLLQLLQSMHLRNREKKTQKKRSHKKKNDLTYTKVWFYTVQFYK